MADVLGDEAVGERLDLGVARLILEMCIRLRRGNALVAEVGDGPLARQFQLNGYAVLPIALQLSGGLAQDRRVVAAAQPPVGAEHEQQFGLDLVWSRWR